MPLRTIARALQVATEGSATGDVGVSLDTPDGGDVYLLDATIELPDRVSVFGGFDDGWLRDALSRPTPIRVDAPVALRAAARSRDLELSGLAIVAIEAFAPEGGESDSVAIEVVGAPTVRIDRVIARGSDLVVPTAVLEAGSSEFESGSSFGVENFDDVTFTLGRAGAGATVAAESNRPFSGP